MCRADVWKIASGCLNIVVITGDTCLVQSVQLFCRKKSHGGTQIDLTLFFIVSYAWIALSNSSPVSALPAVTIEKRSTPSRSFILHAARISSSGRKSYSLTVCMMVCRLCTVFTVLGHLPLRLLIIEHRSTLSPIRASLILSAPYRALKDHRSGKMKGHLPCDSSSVNNFFR